MTEEPLQVHKEMDYLPARRCKVIQRFNGYKLAGATVTCPVPACREKLSTDFHQACFVFDKDLEDVIDGSTRQERRKQLDKFLVMVNTLMNEGGGAIYIHTKPHLLAFWDEQVDDDLMDLVPDGTLFRENFERHMRGNHVIFRVKPTGRPLSTLEFNSKISLNKGLVDPTHLQMQRLMKEDRLLPDYMGNPGQTFDSNNLLKGREVQFFEDVNMQAKVVYQKHLDKAKGHSKAIKLLNYWWNELKLPNYIAAFAKQGDGGSFFLGLREDKKVTNTKWKHVPNTEGLGTIFGGESSERQFWVDDKNSHILHVTEEEHVPKWEHKSGRFVCEGVLLTKKDKEELMKQLDKRIKDLLWQPITDNPNNNHPAPNDVVTLSFHLVSLPKDEEECHPGGARGGSNGRRRDNSCEQLYVVEARVNYFHGVCFQSKHGPEAYHFDHPKKPRKAVPVKMEEWVKNQQCIASQA